MPTGNVPEIVLTDESDLFGEDLMKVAYKYVSECDCFTKRVETGSFVCRPHEVGSKDSSKVQWCHLVHFLMVCNLEQGTVSVSTGGS